MQSTRIKICTCSVRTYVLNLRVRAYYMSVGGITAKFKTANIYISAARDQTTKFKDCQYFWPHGIESLWECLASVYTGLYLPGTKNLIDLTSLVMS